VISLCSEGKRDSSAKKELIECFTSEAIVRQKTRIRDLLFLQRMRMLNGKMLLMKLTKMEKMLRKTKEKNRREKLKKLLINTAHHYWSHKGDHLLHKTAKRLNIELIGTLSACEGCGLATASQKAVSKTTNTKATNFCERIFVDGTGPFQTTIAGNRYWFQLVDDCMRKGWNHFQPTKSKLDKQMEALVVLAAKTKGNFVKYLRCDGVGKNEEPLKKVCKKHGIIMEKTAPHTPQQNGVVERRITLIHQRAHAQLLLAGLDEARRHLLWAASVDMANTMENITATNKSAISADELATGEQSKLFP
jgi:hypothetical protein